jgi:hypothetical protein
MQLKTSVKYINEETLRRRILSDFCIVYLVSAKPPTEQDHSGERSS